MGRASKSSILKKRKRRLEAKRRKKALYKALSEARKGESSSKRKARREKKAKRFKMKRHDMRYCGNAGCRRCHPDPSRPKYPNKVFSRLVREAKGAA